MATAELAEILSEQKKYNAQMKHEADDVGTITWPIEKDEKIEAVRYQLNLKDKASLQPF